MHATLDACVSAEALRSHISRGEPGHSSLADTLGSARQPLGTSPLLLEGEPRRSIRDVAERVYLIRNRIVHAKDADDDARSRGKAPFYAFSSEASELDAEIEVMRFLAPAVLRGPSSVNAP